ncbi:MAG: riboflavin biosynthesis protein RibF [Aquificae bacterium]|nr:riboflavin biosynthesis protein RibF [Aquificota bacterium]
MRVYLLGNEPCPETEPLKEPPGNLALTVGNFDGVHLGHRALINELVRRARERGLKPWALTFCPHPFELLGRPFCELTDLHEKLKLMSELPLEGVVVARFETVSSLEPEEFLGLLTERLGVKYLLVGYDWRFGKGRKGDAPTARKIGLKLGLEVESFGPVKVKGRVVSSSLIRELLKQAKLDEAAELLGRRYWVERKVVKGRGLGTKLGFPTANLEGTERLCLKEGVYEVLVDGKLKGVANYGRRPTLGGEERRLEVHLPGFKGSLEGRYLRVEFLRFLREERKFPSLEALRAQIEKDVKRVVHD